MIIKFRKYLSIFIDSVSALLSRIGVKPWQLTLLSLLLSLLSFYVLISNIHPSIFTIQAVILYLLSGIMDGLDGALARYQQCTSNWGAFYDSFIDRCNEIIFVLGLVVGNIVEDYVGLLYATTSILISYIRARAEGLNVDLKGKGMMERPERVISLSLVLLIWIFIKVMLSYMMWLLVILNIITIIERVNIVHRRLH